MKIVLKFIYEETFHENTAPNGQYYYHAILEQHVDCIVFPIYIHEQLPMFQINSLEQKDYLTGNNKFYYFIKSSEN